MSDVTGDDRTVIRDGRHYKVRDEHPYPDSRIDNWDFWSRFGSGWEPYLENVLGRFLSRGNAFVDVGAWIGPVTLIAARMCKHVYAIEPDPIAVVRLEVNVAKQRRANAVSVHRLAITGADGVAPIGHRADRVFGDSMTSTIFAEGAVEVRAQTLPGFLREHVAGPVGLVKMDIEGAEQDALPAAAPYLREHNIPILLSTHAALVSDAPAYAHTIRSALDGWSVTHVSGISDMSAGNGTYLAEPA